MHLFFTRKANKKNIISFHNKYDISKFNLNLEIDSDITALEYYPINKLIYFVNYTEKGSELYKYPFRWNLTQIFNFLLFAFSSR